MSSALTLSAGLYLLAPVIILAVVLVVKYFIAASDLPDWFKFALLK